MMMPSHMVRILVATQPVDFRKGHDGLAAQVQSVLQEDRWCHVWTYMDPTLLQRFWLVRFRITIADVYPASLSGPIHCHREPRWISACLSLIGSKASALLCRSTHQVQEATVRVMSPSHAKLLQYSGFVLPFLGSQCLLIIRQQVDILYRRTRLTRRSSRSCLQVRQQPHSGAAGHAFGQSKGFWHPSCHRPSQERRGHHGSSRCVGIDHRVC